MSMNPKAAEALARPHALQMENREKLRLTGVSDVNGFDESLIVLTTDMGELSIRGEALHIEKIDLDAGADCPDDRDSDFQPDVPAAVCARACAAGGFRAQSG